MTPVEQGVRAAVRRKVLQGGYTSDCRISEVTIANELNVSRTPARAALIALEAEGLIEKRTGRGYTAKQISSDDISKAIQVKAALEGLAARFLASKPLSTETLDKLEHSLSLTAKAANSRAFQRRMSTPMSKQTDCSTKLSCMIVTTNLSVTVTNGCNTFRC